MTSREEVLLQSALEDLSTRPPRSISATARDWTVNRHTLKKRLSGVTSRKKSHERQQRMTNEQENHLCQWIISMESDGHAPNRAQIIAMANQLRAVNNDPNVLGVNWLYKFIKRHDSVRALIGRSVDAQRINGCTPEAINAFFDVVEGYQARYNIKSDDIWNMDETGLAIGGHLSTHVYGGSENRSTLVKEATNREWVTVIECIGVGGRTIRPLIIFKGKHVQEQWFDKESPDWLYTSSENAWTTSQIGYGWLKDVFIPETKNQCQNRLLILDGHSTHADVDFMVKSIAENVYCAYLPPHTSHLLQPLDVAVFSPLKQAYRAAHHEMAVFDDSAPADKQRFINCYTQARRVGFTSRNICSAFRATGLYPYDRQKALSSDFVKIGAPRDTQPSTPPLQPVNIGQSSLLHTPTTRLQIEDSLSAEVLTATAQSILVRIGNKLDRQQAQIAELRDTLRHRDEYIKRLTAVKSRRRLQKPLNQRFCTALDIAKNLRSTVTEGDKGGQMSTAIHQEIEENQENEPPVELDE